MDKYEILCQNKKERKKWKPAKGDCNVVPSISVSIRHAHLPTNRISFTLLNVILTYTLITLCILAICSSTSSNIKKFRKNKRVLSVVKYKKTRAKNKRVLCVLFLLVLLVLQTRPPSYIVTFSLSNLLHTDTHIIHTPTVDPVWNASSVSALKHYLIMSSPLNHLPTIQVILFVFSRFYSYVLIDYCCNCEL